MKHPHPLAISAAVLVTACTAPPRTPPPPAPRADVALTTADTTTVPSQFEAGGVVRARLVAPVSARVLAPIIDVRVRAGSRVRHGDTLVVLDLRELQAQADRASAALVAAEQAVRAAESEKEAADAGLTLAAVSFDRMNGLYAKRSATRQELDDSTAGIQTARARASSAAARVAEAQAALVAARAGASAASITAAYSTIVAPFDGIVAERFVDPGVTAAPGSPLLTLEDPSSFRLELRLDEARATQIVVGQMADVLIESGEWTAGRVAEVSRIDPASHGFVAKLDVPSSSGCRSGAFGRARFTVSSRNALTAPSTSVIRRGQLAFVFAVDRDGLARLRPVSTGATSAGRIEILSGVQSGDELVLDPPLSFGDGTRVRSGGKP